MCKALTFLRQSNILYRSLDHFDNTINIVGLGELASVLGHLRSFDRIHLPSSSLRAPYSENPAAGANVQDDLITSKGPKFLAENEQQGKNFRKEIEVFSVPCA